MGIKTIDIVATLAINLIQFACSDHILSCNVTAWNPCPGSNQFCQETTSTCECVLNYVRDGDDCVSPHSDTPSAHNTTTIVATIFALALVICGLVLVVRKYNLIEYARQKFRRNTDVMYEDVMIGNDDPPLSP